MLGTEHVSKFLLFFRVNRADLEVLSHCCFYLVILESQIDIILEVIKS